MSKQLATVFSVNVNVPVEKKDGGTYQAAQIQYQTKGTDGTVGNIVTKAVGMQFLATNPDLQSKIMGLSQADLPTDVVIHTEQNGNFTNIVDILSTDEVNPAELSAPTTKPVFRGTQGKGNFGGGGTQQRSTGGYQGKSANNTGGESADKSASINRAVALKAAVEYSAGKTVTPENVIVVAKTFEGYLKG